jgi:hypothetical protein
LTYVPKYNLPPSDFATVFDPWVEAAVFNAVNIIPGRKEKETDRKTTGVERIIIKAHSASHTFLIIALEH